MPFFVLFLFLLPFLEIYSLIVVGNAIGVLPTLALVVGLTIFGAYLLYEQGLSTLFKAQKSLAEGKMPVAAMLDGLGLTVAACLLITPGLITEVMGFALLVPQIRLTVMQWALGRLLQAHLFAGSAAPDPRAKPSQGATPGSAPKGGVIEGDFRRLDD